MDKHLNKEEKKITGIRANSLLVPFLVILVILHSLVMLMFMNISNESRSLATNMEKLGTYTGEASSLLSNLSTLCDTSNTFILKPIKENGELNTSPLASYAVELIKSRRGNQVVEKFRSYGIAENDLYYIEEAAKSADYVLECQIHALSLMDSVYSIPSFSPYNNIHLIELSDEEKAMSDEERIALAESIILSSDYSEEKGLVSTNVNTFIGLLQSNSAQESTQIVKKLQRNKSILLVVSILNSLVLLSIFISIFRQVVKPLVDLSKKIADNEKLDENKGFKEVRLVGSAYNKVSKEREELDAILRSAAETDALTNLPNRYSFERYQLDSEKSGISVAVLLFDANYLKITNDTKGHVAGDKLLCDTAYCITKCFGNKAQDNCFRIGGDEFAAIIKNCTVKQIEDNVKEFIEMQKKYGISVSVGYTYSDDIGNTTYKDLIEKADKKMYANKEKMHKEI